MSMSGFDQDALVALLSTACDGPPAPVDAIQRHGLRALLGGRPATTRQISARSGLGVEEIRAGIDGLTDAGRIETEGDEIVGVCGLTVTETVHELALAETTAHTWCALDAIGIPVALGLDAEVSTPCPHCGTRLQLTLHNGEALTDRPVRLLCPTGPCPDVRADFCSSANLFCDLDHLRAWRARHRSIDGRELDLAGTAELGRAMWGRYADDPEHHAGP
jgi:alkylmercury lyase